jgi:hypothetical protein
MDEPWINKKQKSAGGHQVMMNSQTETEIRNEKQKKQHYVDRRSCDVEVTLAFPLLLTPIPSLICTLEFIFKFGSQRKNFVGCG